MKFKYSVGLLTLTVLITPLVTLAAFKPLVGIPGVDGNADFNTYINALYALSISIAALLAVIKIIIAGVKWMLSDLVTSKQEAKSDMQGALLGLLIVISAVVVLNTINPQLTQTSIFVSPVDKVTNIAANPGAAGAAPVGNVMPKTLDCVENVDVAASAAIGFEVKTVDCSVANKACTDGKGKVGPYVNPLNGNVINNKITCSYGFTITSICTPVPPANFDCTSAQEACVAQKGSVNLVNGGSQVKCIVPY